MYMTNTKTRQIMCMTNTKYERQIGHLLFCMGFYTLGEMVEYYWKANWKKFTMCTVKSRSNIKQLLKEIYITRQY